MSEHDRGGVAEAKRRRDDAWEVLVRAASASAVADNAAAAADKALVEAGRLWLVAGAQWAAAARIEAGDKTEGER